jgi:hypothetical protein
VEHRNPDSKLGRAADAAKEKLGRAKDGVVSTAHVVKDRTVQAAATAARVVREAEPDAELKASVSTGTEHALDRAGQAVSGAAPAIGRGTEYAVGKVGQALKYVAHPIAFVIGTIAGTVGGWWKKAAELRNDLPHDDEQACRAHFATIVIGDDMTFDRARPGYTLGYIAAGNPDYRDRGFEEIEGDLRIGFPEAPDEYDRLRDFARYGFERGRGHLGTGSPGLESGRPG